MKVCFIGHKTIEITEELVILLKSTVLSLIERGATTFLFGSMSEFDSLSLEVVTEFKKTYPRIKRVYIRSAFPNISELYKRYLLEYYEETYFPDKLEKAGKYSYVERNYEMIDKSDYCVFYYNKNYTPIVKNLGKSSSNNGRNSGTKVAYEYAVKRNKNVINLYNSLNTKKE